MIKILIGFGLVLARFLLWAQDGFLEYIPLLDPARIKVEFVITNDPTSHKLFLYRAKPLNPSPVAGSNLIALLKFDLTNRVHRNDLDGLFKTLAADRELSSGFNFISEEWDQIPQCSEAVGLASNILFNALGVSPNEVARKLNGAGGFSCSEGTITQRDRKTKQLMKRVSERRVGVARAIDGFTVVAGFHPDGFAMQLRDDGAITIAEFRWPPVERIKPVGALTLAEVQKFVAEGRTRCQTEGIERIVVERVDYYYDRHGQPPAPVMYYPLARLIGQGYGLGTNRLIYIFCELPKLD